MGRTLVALTRSSTSRTPRSLASPPTTRLTSSCSPAMLVVSCRPSLSSTPSRLCSTSSPGTPPRWPVRKKVSLSRRLPSLPALPSLSWPCTRCATPRCWQTRSPTTTPTHGCSTPVGSVLVSPPVASAAHSSTPAPSSTPSTAASWPRSTTRPTTSSTCPCPRRAGPAPPTSPARSPSSASCSRITSRSTRTRLRLRLSTLARRCNGKKGKLGIRAVETLQNGCEKGYMRRFFFLCTCSRDTRHLQVFPVFFFFIFFIEETAHSFFFFFFFPLKRVYESTTQKIFCSNH